MKNSPCEYSGSFGCPRNRGKFSYKGNERKLIRGKAEGCQRACHLYLKTARYMKRMEPPLRSGFVGRPPATLEKRIPVNLFGFI